jgi:hypothetical protein
MNSPLSPAPVSDAIGQLLELLLPYSGSGEVVIPGASWDAIIAGLDGVRRAAFHMECELGAFRLLEAGRFARGTMEEVATGALGELVLDPEAKIVRPDFGRRP